MGSEIERAADELGLHFEPTQTIFNLAEEDRAILDRIALETPQVLAALDSVRNKIPVPNAAQADLSRNFYRLPSQNRSFCYSLVASDSGIDGPVIVFKGSEPLLSDFEVIVDWMLQAPLRKSSRVMTDHFPLAEGKIPGALSLKEANREARIALEVQKKHLIHYGELASIPTPLLIHRISENRRVICASMLRAKLSSAAFERIQPLLESGLAIYIYYYPSPPIRANYLSELPIPNVRKFIDETLNKDIVVASWIKLIVRLLYLGYLPYSVRNEGLGACMDFGNATLDGGFCDPDSIIAIEPNMDDEFFRESAIQSLAILQDTVQRLLDLKNAPALYPSIEEFVCRQYLQQLLSRAVESELRPGLRLDVRFPTLLTPLSVSDIMLCTRRKNRVRSYKAFAKGRAKLCR